MKKKPARKQVVPKHKPKKPKKTAALVKKAVKKTVKPKAARPKTRKPTMATKKEDKADAIDTGPDHPALKPDGTPYEGPDPMAPPPDGPLSPSEAARVDQGGEVDLSGSPGSAGEHVPVIETEQQAKEREAQTGRTERGETPEERKAREAKDRK